MKVRKSLSELTPQTPRQEKQKRLAAKWPELGIAPDRLSYSGFHARQVHRAMGNVVLYLEFGDRSLLNPYQGLKWKCLKRFACNGLCLTQLLSPYWFSESDYFPFRLKVVDAANALRDFFGWASTCPPAQRQD